MKRVFIIHGWGGFPGEAWYQWLKKELETRGFLAQVPAMPDTETPKIDAWVSHLSEVVGEPDEDTFLVGHSIGCQTIARYLETFDEGKIIGGVVFVCGWAVSSTGLAEEEKPVAKPWIETPINWEKVRQHSKNFIAIHSDNDPFVPLDNADFFKEKLGAEIIIEHGKGHMGDSEGFTELPSVLNAVLKIASQSR